VSRHAAEPLAETPLGRVAEFDQLAAQLAELGLTLTEARVYIALLGAPVSTAAQAAERAGVARPKVYEALRGLEEHGLCRSIVGRTTAFRAVAAADGLPGLVRRRELARQLQAERDAHVARTLIEALPTPPPESQPDADRALDYLEAVVGRPSTSAALERLVTSATRDIAMMQQPPFLQPRSRWNEAERAALDRGVKLRVIYSVDCLDDRDRYAALLDTNAELRVADELSMKLLVRDGEEAMLSLREPGTNRQSLTSMVVQHPDLVRSFVLLFEQQWSTARPLADVTRTAD
jgi:HTH-type transcriptional regulator, sugar sensing transcriptional regulator